jgi:hypothetical protein
MLEIGRRSHILPRVDALDELIPVSIPCARDDQLVTLRATARFRSAADREQSGRNCHSSPKDFEDKVQI